MKEYDVVVIGAGFGGPVAAKKCAEAGFRTLMLERSARVGEKVISGLTIPFYGFLFGPAFIRDGNPPIERPVDGIINYIIKDIEAGDIEIDDSLRIPRPLSPILAFGYNAYCRPFCQWEAEKAVESGVELRTSTTVVELLKEDGRVVGVKTDKGEEIRARLVIDGEGSQGLLAVGAGIREKYPPEVISLADVYDYEMAKEDVDEVFGYTLRFCWGWDEQRIAPPLGHGNGLMVWPYRESVHFCQDQCLAMDDGKVPNLRKLFEEYHRNLTSGLPWWREEIAPRARLRARVFENFEIFVGLNERLRAMPNHADGIILIGDAAGLESTELCDGVPAAWFSADIAADVAIEALRAGDVSASFLSRYDQRVRAHPIIQWSITAPHRYNLRFAQEHHSLEELRRYVHDGWGLGGFAFMSSALVKMILQAIREDPMIITSWLRMFPRYYYNWLYERYDYSGGRGEPARDHSREPRVAQAVLRAGFKLMDSALALGAPLVKAAAGLLEPVARFANPAMKVLLPGIEALMRGWKKVEPALAPLSDRMIDFVGRADPAVFAAPRKGGG
ncbi:MAG: NAD(P)/FAD-dependent oxidoreductase [Actinobacteria bacterium]|nr:NAD(P)/FAD-dependent oxidoreductase [Actinomycetota bacterium]